MVKQDINIDKSMIILRLREIFTTRLNFDINQNNGALLDQHLLGTQVNLQARDLICLYFDIEKEFDICIPEEDINDEKFNTFNNTVDIIVKELENTN